MIHYVFKRLVMAALVVLAVSTLAFSMIYLSGDPAVALAGEGASQADIERVRHAYGYDQPILVQYGNWLWDAVRGDLGESNYLNEDVGSVILERLPTTMLLGSLALTFALVLSIPLGVLAAIRPNSLIDRISLTIAVIGQAMPTFWFALTLMLWFGVYWQLLPISGTDSWLNFIMPSVALGYYVTPAVMRLTRAGMLEVLSSDYIRTARAKGLSKLISSQPTDKRAVLRRAQL
jgi:peptide/nickel transport system permease protein